MKIEKILPIKKNDYMQRLVLLFAIEYFSAYYIQVLTPFIALAVTVYSYYILVKQKNFAPVVMLILSSRVINGYIIVNSSLAYTLFMAVTYYLPALLFVFITVGNKRLMVGKKKFKMYWALALYCTMVLMCFFINIKTAKSLFLTSVFPLMLFAYVVFFVNPKEFAGCLEPT